MGPSGPVVDAVGGPGVPDAIGNQHVNTTVVMTTYQGARFVERQVESLLAQTLPPAELIIADDGSTDGTVDIVRRVVGHAPFPVDLRVNERRKGYRRNFLDAASSARSSLIAFSDQDDEWHPDKLARMTEVMADPSILLAYHNARIVDGHGLPQGRLYGSGGARVRRDSRRRQPWAFSLGFTQVFRRELLRYRPLHAASRDFLFDAEHLAHDQWFFLLASGLGRVEFVDEDLVSYRQHSTNVYGIGSKPVLLDREVIRSIADDGWKQLELRRSSARASAGVFASIAAQTDQSPALSARARASSAHYRAVSALYSRRQRIYRGTVLRRTWDWGALIASWPRLLRLDLVYSARHAVRDLVLGIVLGRGSQGPREDAEGS